MARMIRTIRLEVSVDPDVYARKHGVDVFEAIDHAAKRVEHMARTLTRDEDSLTVKRSDLLGGIG